MLGVLAPLVLLATVAGPTDVAVTLGNGRGSCSVQGVFTAPVSRAVAWQVLTDYDSLGRFVHSIVSSRLERQPDGRLLVRQEAVGGPPFLRQHVHVSLALDLDPASRIAFHDVLGRDFASYVGEWRVSGDSTATRVEYRLEAEPRGFLAHTFCKGALHHMAQELLTEVRDEMSRRMENMPAP
jgi:carbon monoxide dehydrogenase subunit G